MENNQFVSDIITKKEINTWKDGDSIRILGQTGSGKSYWAVNTLAPTCRKELKTILYLTHRTSLRKQITHDVIISGVDDVVDVRTYQNIIAQYKADVLDLSNYDIIVYDEFQFLVNDSNFISDTEIIYNLIKEDNKHTKVFISANDMTFGIDFNKHYIIGTASKDISDRVNMTYLLEKKSDIAGVIENILDNSEDDKIFCYVNNNETLEELYHEFKDETMLYVSNNSPLSRYMNKEYADVLSTTNKLSQRVLLSSSAIDAGVSIKDDKVKHIIVDERDAEQLYQIIGRKRLVEDETIDLYIVNIGNQRLAGYSTTLNRKLDMISQFEEDKNLFCQKYGRDNLDNTIFYNDLEGVLQLNKMAKYKLNNLREQYDLYFELGYQGAIEKLFNIKLINLSMEKKQLELSDYLESIVGKELYQEEQQVLSDKIASKLANSKSIVRGKKMRPSTMEKILRDEFKLDYSFSSVKRKQQTIDGKKTTRRYVVLNKLK